MTVLGIDPGRTGGAVLIDERSRLVWAASWRPCSVGYRVDVYIDNGVDQERVHGSASKLGDYLSSRCVLLGGHKPLLGCEDVFVHKQRPNVRSSVSLARWSGAVMAPLELLTSSPAVFAQAAVWRRSILGLSPYTKRETAKAAALRYLPALVPGLDAVLAALGPLDHLADAAGIALHRQRT